MTHYSLKKMKKQTAEILAAGLLLLTLVGCGSRPDGPKSEEKPSYSIQLISYGDYPESKLMKLRQDIQNCFDTLIPEITVTVEVRGNTPIPEWCWNQSHSRLRADSILRYQNRVREDKNVYLLGVTSKDISTTAHGQADWGVLGLSFCPGHSAVVSSFRVKDKSLFYKVAVHELLHCFGLPHCPNKDRSCYICDAAKHPQLDKQTRLCPDCKEKLLNRTKH